VLHAEASGASYESERDLTRGVRVGQAPVEASASSTSGTRRPTGAGFTPRCIEANRGQRRQKLGLGLKVFYVYPWDPPKDLVEQYETLRGAIPEGALLGAACPAGWASARP
jgi:hypothetical protein